jgi:hypothetical protein
MTFFRTTLMAAAMVAICPATTDAFSMNPAMAYFTQMIEHKLQHQAKEVGVPKQKNIGLGHYCNIHFAIVFLLTFNPSIIL